MMHTPHPTSVPEYDLPHLIREAAGAAQHPSNLYISEPERFAHLLASPYRAQYYAFGLCLRGSAQLRANLHHLSVTEGDVVVMSRDIIRSWQQLSPDYRIVTVFFTAEHLPPGHADCLRLFAPQTVVVAQLAADKRREIAHLIETLRRKASRAGARAGSTTTLATAYLHVLLYELEQLLTAQRPAAPPGTAGRPQELLRDFRQRVSEQFRTQRLVRDYAGQLCVTPKHLNDTVKQLTGHPASYLIAEMLGLEAKVLLRQTALSVAEVADQLHFSDASAFGKFFRGQTGQSPTEFRQNP